MAVLCGGAVMALSAGAFASTPPTSTTTTSSTAAPPTVAPFTAPTTTVAVDPSSTTTTTMVSPAIGAPVITLVPLGPEEQAVVDALYEARVVAVEALMDPDAPGLDERLDATYARSGQARGRIEELREQYRLSGLRVYVNTAVPWSMSIEQIAFFMEPYRRADVTVCFLDSGVLYEPGGAPDGSDVIVNSDIVATRLVYSMVPEEGRWQLWHSQRISEPLIGATECALSE